MLTETDNRATKDRILDEAERLFAEQGFTATSLRAITSAAEVNLAAVNYHFGSKDGLIEAVFSRRLEPLTRRRLELLDAMESRDRAPTVEQILEAFVGPPLRQYLHLGRAGATLMRLLGRTMTEPSPLLERIFKHQFRETAARFTTALRRALPELPAEDVFWRLHFCVGTMAHSMSDTFRLRMISQGRCDGTDVEETVERLVAFLAGGMRAPSTRPVEERRR